MKKFILLEDLNTGNESVCIDDIEYITEYDPDREYSVPNFSRKKLIDCRSVVFSKTASNRIVTSFLKTTVRETVEYINQHYKDSF